MVPDNANVLLQNSITQAEANGGNFESASVSSPVITDLVNLVITDGVRPP